MVDPEVQGSPTETLAYSLVGDRLHLVEREIERACNSEIALVRRHSEYVLRSGGKRLRPAMVLLCTNICGYKGDDDVFIHTATLVHDDILDGAEVRRGQEAANQVWGNKLAVLLGDYIYMRSLAMSVGLGSLRLVEILTEATSRLLEGEILDVSNNGNVELTDEDYLETIDRKTACCWSDFGNPCQCCPGI